MGHQKSRNFTTRFRPADDDALDAVAAELRMERADAIRFLIHEKARALGLGRPVRSETPEPPVAAAPPPSPARGRRGR